MQQLLSDKQGKKKKGKFMKLDKPKVRILKRILDLAEKNDDFMFTLEDKKLYLEFKKLQKEVNKEVK